MPLLPRRFTSSVFVRLYVSAAALLIGGLDPDPVSSAKPSCPPGQFRDVASAPTGRCTPCSTCPINHIVRRPCGRLNDTVCGPFYEFEFSHQPARSNGTAAAVHSLAGNRTYLLSKQLGYRLGDGYGQSVDDSVVSTATTTQRTPQEEEAVTVRCGQPQWRMLCYGLVATLVVIVSVALTFFALFTYCRTSVKTVRLDETSAVATGRWEVNDDDDSSSTIVVNRDVRHLEEQLIHNQRRKALLRWLFGSASAADRLFSSNDYLDERHRRRFIRMLGGSSAGDAPLPLEPYPGMTLAGRTTTTADQRRSPVQSDSGEEMTSARERTGGLDSREECDSVDETQVEEQNSTMAERGLLMLHEARLQNSDGN